MGFSKKRLKNKTKQELNRSDKSKQKFKLSKQIEGRKQLQESKRKAADITGKKAQGNNSKGDSVDELFASLGGDDDFTGEEDEWQGRASGGGDDDDDDDASSCSSAGAFHDVDEGDDIGPEDLAALEDVGAKGKKSEAQRHEEELAAIKKRDPEFYKFLVEQDQQLLDFRAEDVPAEDRPDDAPDAEGEEEEAKADDEEHEEDFAAVEAADKAKAGGRLLTLERYKQIQSSAKDSFTAFKAALNAYHTAVRSIEGAPEAEGAADMELSGAGAQPGDEEAKSARQKAVQKQRRKAEKERSKSASSRKRTQRYMLTIDNEATFSEVLEWSIANIPALLRHHAGAELATGAGNSKKQKKKQKKGKAEDSDSAEGASSLPQGLYDPSHLEKWRRVKVLANIFWDETLFLINNLGAPEMLEFVLRACSTPEALCWLWPFKHMKKRYLRRCCSLWALGGGAATQSVRLLAFLFIRNYAAMALHSSASTPGKKGQDSSEMPELESLMRGVLRAFAEAASGGYSWRSLSSFRFMENCLLELFRIEDASAYRVGYVCIRQLALILRNACVATSQGISTTGDSKKSNSSSSKNNKNKKKGKNPNKLQQPQQGKKKKSTHMKQVEALVSWPFVRTLYMWTKAVGGVSALKPLAYPLSMILLGAIKSRLTSLQHFPFVFHGLLCLNRMSASLEAFVPISAHLLKVLSVLIQTMDRQSKNKGRKGEGQKSQDADPEDGFVDPKKSATVAKAPDVDVLLHFASGQAVEPFTLEVIGSTICALFTEHLGLVSRSPGFPEIAAPVLLHLRRHSKHCRSEALRRQLKTLVTSIDDSVSIVRRHREALTKPPPTGKLYFLDADSTPLARKRTQVLKSRATEEKQNVEAEIKAEAEPPEGGYRADKKRKRKEERQQQREAEGTQAGDSAPLSKKAKKKAKKAASASAVAQASGAAAHADVVEEMGFSSGDED